MCKDLFATDLHSQFKHTAHQKGHNPFKEYANNYFNFVKIKCLLL